MRVILTGAPGTGKSALVAALAARGWVTSPEVSREVIRQQGLTPWDAPVAWAEACGQRMRERAVMAPSDRTVIFDRAEPDLVAYLAQAGYKVDLHTPLADYALDVLILPGWRQIYRRESDRRQAWDEAVELDGRLRQVYAAAGYRLHDVPCLPLAARADWVETWLQAHGQCREGVA